jgi:hypothetical protein
VSLGHFGLNIVRADVIGVHFGAFQIAQIAEALRCGKGRQPCCTLSITAAVQLLPQSSAIPLTMVTSRQTIEPEYSG